MERRIAFYEQKCINIESCCQFVAYLAGNNRGSINILILVVIDSWKGKDEMNAANIVYKVWIPGQAPTAHKPTLALYSQHAVKFFVEAIVHQTQLFAEQSFAMCAYHIQSQGEEQEISQGVYQFRPDNNGRIRLWTLYEAGMLAEYGGCGIISQALIEACMQIEEEHEQRHLPHL